MKPKLITTTEAATRLKQTRVHVTTLCRTGKLKAVKVKGEWRIYESALKKWLKKPPKRGRPKMK